jgi:threonyl-tRNA synthetase
MNDAHIYCTKNQIEEEVEGVLSMIKYYYEVFGFKDYSFRLSLWDPSNSEKYINEPENWEYSEEVLRRVLKKLNLKFVEVKNEAAFYGPKIDVQLKNVYGKEETMSTVQLDFSAKKRFDLHYDDAEGHQNNEVFVIHRAPLSTHERFIAFLIENYKGKFPLWLSPVQVKIVTVNDGNIEYAEKVLRLLKEKNIRAELDKRAESIGKKVRTAILERVNYIVTIGDQEVNEDILAIRDREGKLDKQKLDYFMSNMTEEIRKKC